MENDIYLCIDKQSYKYALTHYATEYSKIFYCNFSKKSKRMKKRILENIEKEIYILYKCGNGYIKFNLWEFAASPNMYDGYFIPDGAETCVLTRKPQEYQAVIIGNEFVPIN
ncbi:MAG: hypothetical protein J5896_03295 [Alphaproteobacteria bacterium]|nr:hypothetical protein [Alphaproteobacteria bacterium]